MINKEKINETVAVLQSAATNEELLTAALKDVDADTIITMLRNVYAYGLRTAMEGISRIEDESEARPKLEKRLVEVEPAYGAERTLGWKDVEGNEDAEDKDILRNS